MDNNKTPFLNPEDTSSCVSIEEKPPVYAFGSIRLLPGVTKTNYICSLMFLVIMIFSIAGVGNLQLLILLDANYYNIPQDHMGTTNSIILAVQFVVKMATVVLYGHLSDKFGRRTIIFVGSLSFTASCFLVPMFKTFYPGFIIATMVAANSGAAFSSVPLLADYVADESKGKASAVFGVVACLSAIIANLLIKVLLYTNLPLGTCYHIVGVSIFCMFLLNSLGLQGGTFHLQAQRSVLDVTEPQKPVFESMKEALQIFKGNNWLKISLVLQIFGSSDFAVFMSFISFYIKSLFSADTPVVDQNTTVNNFQTMILVMMMISNATCGYLIDKKNMVIQSCMYALLGGAASLMLLAFSFKPTAITLYVGAVLFGLTLPGLGTITNLLNLKNFPADKRGVMTGFCQMISNISYSIIAGGGGLLYDNWKRNGPFVICAGLLVFAAFLVLIIFARIKIAEGKAKPENKASSSSVGDSQTPVQNEEPVVITQTN